MKELYTSPELEIITFVPVENLASGYLDGYAKTIGATGPETRDGNTSEVDVSVDNGEGSPY